MAHLHISQRPDPPRMVQNKLPRETQPVSEWRLFNLHPFKRFTFPGGFDTFFFMQQLPHSIASAFNVKTEHEGREYKKQNGSKFCSILICLFLTAVSFYHLTAYWLNQSLLWKMGIQESCHIPSSWASLGGKSHRTGCKGTWGETHYYMGWYYTGWKLC